MDDSARDGLPLVVFLHGWGVDSSTLSGVREVVASKYPTLALDFPGFGASPEPAVPWEVSDYVRWTVGEINACTASKVILFGHSFGARVIIKMLGCAEFASTLPFEVSKVIITGGAGVRTDGTSQKGRFSFSDVAYRIAKKILPPDKVAKLAYERGSVDYKAAYDQSQVMGQTFTRVVAEDLTPYLPHIAPEMLLIWGDMDDATDLSHAQIMEQQIPKAGLAVIKGAGHYAFLERPDTFYAIIKSYLQID